MTAREAAYKAVLLFFKNDTYLETSLALYLSEIPGAADRALAYEISFGTLENARLIDFNIKRFCSADYEKMQIEIKCLLRTAYYQAVFLDKIPAYSICDESVKIAKKFISISSSKLVNAVVRRFCGSKLFLSKSNNQEKDFSINYSVDETICKIISEEYGKEKLREIMEAAKKKDKGLFIVINTKKINVSEYLEKAEIDAKIEENNLVRIHSTAQVRLLYGYSEGYFHVQDKASFLCASMINAKSGETVLDLCAAPGGKIFTAFEHSEDGAKFYAFDINDKKTNQLKENAARLGFAGNIAISKGNARVFNPEIPQAEWVLCDVPCSGLGTISKNPEVRYKNAEAISQLPEIQKEILENAAKYVKPDGTLIYSTCTIIKSENENIVNDFLSKNAEFSLIESKKILPCGDNAEGFFIAKMKKRCKL